MSQSSEVDAKLSEKKMFHQEKSKHLLSFGVLTDVQYANRDDCQSWYAKDKWRYYRNSLNLVRKAFKIWKEGPRQISFAMQLGDLVDGCNRTMNLDSEAAFKKAVSVFEEFAEIPTYHVLGNHELYNFDRQAIQQYLNLKHPNKDGNEINANNNSCTDNIAYYSFAPIPEVLIVVLDCFDVSIPGYKSDDKNYLEAEKLLRNYHVDDNMEKWEYDNHLHGLEKRFVSYNGAIGNDQLEWLNLQLQTAEQHNQMVIICGHISILPESSKPCCVLWNYSEVLSVLHRHHGIVAYLAGHLHENGYGVDSYGIHHVTFAGIIETAPDDIACSSVHIYVDRLEIEGHGRERSYFLPFKLPHIEVENCLSFHPIELKVNA